MSGDGGEPWPFPEAFAYLDDEKRWVQIECAGAGCRHRLPLKIAPLLMVASTKVTYPSREFIGTRLPYGGGGPGGGTDDAQGRDRWGGVGAGDGTGAGGGGDGVPRVGNNFSKVLYIVTLYCKYTRAMTFENLC